MIFRQNCHHFRVAHGRFSIAEIKDHRKRMNFDRDKVKLLDRDKVKLLDRDKDKLRDNVNFKKVRLSTRKLDFQAKPLSFSDCPWPILYS